MKTISAFILSILAILGCKAQHAPLQVVENVDLMRYTGVWYEIASFPQRFQKGCTCSTAEYSLNADNTIKVINRCNKENKKASVTGKAFVQEGTGNAKLKVQFFWPFRGDYWIVELDKDYQWVAVGNESRKYLWILSRTPQMSETMYTEICVALLKKGFDISKLKRTKQDCH